jgi:hypothetical protein
MPMEDKGGDREQGGAGGPARFACGRREFLRAAIACAVLGAGEALRPLRAGAFANQRPAENRAVPKRFVFAQLRYAGGTWDPHPGAAEALIADLERMTSIEARPSRLELTLDAPDLFSHPFLYVAGREDFAPFPPAHVERLRLWLGGGGTLVADDAAATPGYGFSAAIRRELARVLPGERPERLPSDHTVSKSFFLLRGVGGRTIASPFLEGIALQGRTAVILSANDLGGAWARDPLGRWAFPCVPGGERQRRLAFQLGVNLVMYALCSDYKQDRIHVPFLRQRI